jgi:hypothetical protein
MTTTGRPRIADRLRILLHLDDPPGRIALALGVGVFLGCTPFLGLQTILAIVVATVFSLNRAATVTGVWLNLPWFAPFVYGAALKVGAALVPDPAGVRDAWLAYVVEHPGRLSWRQMLVLLHEVSLTLLVGTAVIGVAAGVATYVVALGIISSRRRAARPPDPGPDDGRSRRYDGDEGVTGHDHTQGGIPGGRARHPVPAGHQSPAQGDAAAGRQAHHPVRGGRGRRLRPQ